MPKSTFHGTPGLVPKFFKPLRWTITSFAALARTGCSVEAVDISGMLRAALLLYDGAIVAERYAAVGAFLATDPAGADREVSAIIGNAGRVSGPAVIADPETLLVAKAVAAQTLSRFDGLLLPTTTEHPSIAAVLADPVTIKRRLGTYTNLCNLLDMAATAFPGCEAGGAPFGAMMVVPAFHDQVALDLAARFLDINAGKALLDNGIELTVFGAHLRGQRPNFELQSLDARFVEPVLTSGAYRLMLLDTDPVKPGLVRVGPGGGESIPGEKWSISPAGLGRLMADLPPPLSLTRVELDNGEWVVGFGCSYQAAREGRDITAFGGWVRYLGAADLTIDDGKLRDRRCSNDNGPLTGPQPDPLLGFR